MILQPTGTWSGGTTLATENHQVGISLGDSFYLSDSTDPLPDLEWIHLGATYDADSGQILFYVNGQQWGNAVSGATGSSRYFTDLWPCYGAISDTQCQDLDWAAAEAYERVLTPTEVGEIYSRLLDNVARGMWFLVSNF